MMASEVARLIGQGMSCAEIGKALGLTKGQVDWIKRRDGIATQWQQPNEWSRSEMDRLESMWVAGKMTREEIATALGRTTQSVAARAARLGIIRKGITWSDADCETLREMYCFHEMDVDEIAEHFGRTRNAIYSKVCTMKITRETEYE